MVNPSCPRVIASGSPVSGFRDSSFCSIVEDLHYLLARDLPNGFQLFRFLGFICVMSHNFARKLPFEMVVPRLQVIYPTDVE